MALDITSPAQPRMLLWGQLMHIRECWIWHLRLRKFIGHGVIVGGFATSPATSLYEIIVSILVIPCARGQSCLLFTKNC